MTDRNKPPKVSLIIPCYNVPEAWIHRAVSSVRVQTIQDYELLIVDDGSEEAFGSTLAGLCEKTERTRLIRLGQSGVSTARNEGMKQAKGEYVAFLDADDILASDFLERALTAARETGADFVIGGVWETKQTDFPYCPPRSDRIQAETFEGEEIIQKLFPPLIGLRYRIRFSDGYINRGPVARLIQRELALETPFDEALSVGEDLIWNLQLLKKSRKVSLVRESWYAYWRNPQSVSHRYHPQLIEECRKQIEKIEETADLSDDIIYSAYTDRIYEHLRMFWFNYLAEERRDNPEHYRETVRRLYTERPWKEVGTGRYAALAKGKKKISALMYRLRIYYALLAQKERRHPSDICGGKRKKPQPEKEA